MANTDKKRLYNALCFFPFIAFVIYFLDMEKDDELKQNIIRGMVLFALYAVLSIILPIFYFSSLLWLAYIGVSAYLWYTAYNWKIDSVPLVDDIIDKIKKNK